MTWAKITNNKLQAPNNTKAPNNKFKTFRILRLKFWYCLLFVVWCLGFTSSVVASPQSFSFVVFGDNQGNVPVFMDVIKKVNQEKNISFVVNVGDLISRGTEPEFIEYLRQISNLKVKVYNVPGNHDMMKYGFKYFKKYFGSYYYSFDYKNAHFIILNNAFKVSFHNKQFQWLRKDLASTKKKNIFVFMHRPTFDPTEIYEGHLMSGRETVKQLMRLFEKHGVDYVFAGHIHGHARSKRNGVVYVVTGGAGAPLYLPRDFGGFHHYVRIDVAGEQIKDKVVRIY